MNIENVEVSIEAVTESLLPSANKADYAPKYTANFDKKDYEWKNELIALGLGDNNRRFTIQGQTAPIAITLASAEYQQRCGTNPRLTLYNKALKDGVLISILEKYDLEVVKNFGSTVKGYDFQDVKDSKTLAQVLAVIVKEYEQRHSENSRPTFISTKDEDIFSGFG